jgi:hypothetical protein
LAVRSAQISSGNSEKLPSYSLSFAGLESFEMVLDGSEASDLEAAGRVEPLLLQLALWHTQTNPSPRFLMDRLGSFDLPP